eukprot:588406-Prorocentrum_minimum.AAC.1
MALLHTATTQAPYKERVKRRFRPLTITCANSIFEELYSGIPKSKFGTLRVSLTTLTALTVC